MRIHLPAVLVVALGLVALPAEAWAAASTGTTRTTSTTSTSRTTGTTSTSRTTGGTRTSTASSSNASLSDLSSAGTSVDDLGRESSTAGSFVGASSSEMSGVVGVVQSGTSTSTSTGNRNTTGGRTGTTNTGRTSTNRTTNNRTRTTTTRATGSSGQTSNSSNTVVNSTLRLGFVHTGADAGEVTNSLSERLSKARRLTALSPVEIVIEGRTATLRGQVATEYDRVLAERLALLEVGIARVNNELVVAGTPEEPE
jgi:hypothetical protein